MDMLTVNEVAALKGCTPRAVKQKIERGTLRGELKQNAKNRPKWYIPLDALPRELQQKYITQHDYQMDMLTVKEVAELKGCTEQYIHRLIKSGKLAGILKQNAKNRPKWYIPVNELPQELQRKYMQTAKNKLQKKPDAQKEYTLIEAGKHIRRLVDIGTPKRDILTWMRLCVKLDMISADDVKTLKHIFLA